MTRRRTIILNVIVALGAVGYIAAVLLLWHDRKSQSQCSGVNVEVIGDSPYAFVTDSVVSQWISDAGLSTIGTEVRSMDLYGIENDVRKHHFVDSVQVYMTLDGMLRIKIVERKPMVRIKGDKGYDFYVDSKYRVLPLQKHYRASVPVVSGECDFGFSADFYGELEDEKYGKDKEYLKKITNFVESVYIDDFLRDLIVQIYIDRHGELELVPRVGDQIIIFGELENQAEKLEKLKKFYLNSFSQEWWAKAKRVNLKFKDQVIVS